MELTNSSTFNVSISYNTGNNTFNNDTHNENGTSDGYNIDLALPFLLIGGFGVLLNLFTIIVLSSSPQLRKKILNMLIIHQSVIDLISSAYLIGTAHLSMADLHGLTGREAQEAHLSIIHDFSQNFTFFSEICDFWRNFMMF